MVAKEEKKEMGEGKWKKRGWEREREEEGRRRGRGERSLVKNYQKPPRTG